MRTLLALASAACLLVAANARADEQADLQKIIDKAIKAQGADKVDKTKKANTFKIKGVVHVMGMDLDFTGDFEFQEPDKIRTVQELTVMGNEIKVVTVVNGDKGWSNIMGNTMELGKDALESAKEDFYAGKVTDLTALKEKGYKLGTLAGKKIDDRETVGISVTHEGHKDIFLFFDKETGMLLAAERQAKDPMGGEEFKQETRFGNYKEVDGVKRPFKINILRNGEKFVEAEVTDYKVLDKLDDSLFAKP
ncbi:MAG TPA: hypothetical protein VKE94_15880 [Gemmataceae bacterium]|nr:hypothetical protein [Gemmataceae bacterium]